MGTASEVEDVEGDVRAGAILWTWWGGEAAGGGEGAAAVFSALAEEARRRRVEGGQRRFRWERHRWDGGLMADDISIRGG
jgi:hypothetical protein